MHRMKVERNGIAGHEVPAENAIFVAIRLDIGHFFQPVGRAVICDASELARREELAPSMRSGDELHACIARHRIERHPHADALPRAHTVIGFIVMPRCRLVRARLLHEHMFMEDACALRLHQFACDAGRRTFLDEASKRFDALPVAIVAEEAPRRLSGGVVAKVRPRLSDVHLHARAQCRNPVREYTAQYSGAIPRKRFLLFFQHDTPPLSTWLTSLKSRTT